MTGLGHSLADLIDGYPATVVKGLALAARANRKQMLTETVIAMSVAVTGALDLALNQGKGRVLEKWVKDVLRDPERETKGEAKMTERAFSFFSSLPRKRRGGDTPH